MWDFGSEFRSPSQPARALVRARRALSHRSRDAAARRGAHIPREHREIAERPICLWIHNGIAEPGYTLH